VLWGHGRDARQPSWRTVSSRSAIPQRRHNDLTQYTLVVDRANARLADRFTPHDPSVLRLLKLVAEAARSAGKPASVCGEMASEPLSHSFARARYDTLSVAPPALPLIKWLIRQVTTAQPAPPLKRRSRHARSTGTRHLAICTCGSGGSEHARSRRAVARGRRSGSLKL